MAWNSQGYAQLCLLECWTLVYSLTLSCFGGGSYYVAHVSLKPAAILLPGSPQ